MLNQETYRSEYKILAIMIDTMARLTAPLLEGLKKEANYPEILLFAKITMSTMSIFTLLPQADKDPNPNAPADVASVASLIRDVVDAFNFLYFMAFDNVSGEELDFRRMTTWLHFLVEQLNVGCGLDVPEDEKVGHIQQIEALRERIRNHPIFATLKKNEAKGVISGNKSFYVTRTQISEKRGAHTKLLNALYRVLSSHTHSYSFGLYLTFKIEGLGSDTEEARNSLTGLLFLLNYYLGATTFEILTRFPELISYIDEKKKDVAVVLSKRFEEAAGDRSVDVNEGGK